MRGKAMVDPAVYYHGDNVLFTKFAVKYINMK